MIEVNFLKQKMTLNTSRDDKGNDIYHYQSEIGEFVLTENSKFYIESKNFYEISDIFYLIYKNNLSNHRSVFYTNEDTDIRKTLTANRFQFINIEEYKEILPEKINEIILWIMECLSLLSDGFGKIIKNFNNLTFCSYDDHDRFYFFLTLLRNKGLINFNKQDFLNNQTIIDDLFITEDGWIFIEENILSRNEKTKRCFVAMFFDNSMNKAYESIESAVHSLGFECIRIDQKEHNNDITDEILYEIRRSRFIISDVTGQRPGVYFEAGYAKGLNIPVIWSCRSDELTKVHFDTRQYSHIVWDNEEDLKEKLISRIKGTIL